MDLCDGFLYASWSHQESRGANKHVWGGLIRMYLKMLSISISNMKGLGVSVTHDDGLQNR